MVLLSIVLACAYLVLQAQYLYYWIKLPMIRPPGEFEPGTKISVIIPSRNEAAHISACVGSVLAQAYPDRLFEVIVVDDYSSDGTSGIVEEQFPGVKLVSLEKAGLPGGKKNALARGIEAASGDWIVTVDADCVLRGNALITSVYAFEKLGYRLVTGPVLISEARGALTTFQRYEVATLMLITGSGYLSGLHALANGAFLSFEKASYAALGAGRLRQEYASGDDMFLAEALYVQLPGQTGFLKNRDVGAETRAESTWTSFMLQRIRWASKNSHLENRKVNFIWGFAWVYCVFILVSLLASFVSPSVWLPVFCILLTAKLIGDLAVMGSALSFFRIAFSLRKFILSEMYHIPYVFLAGAWVLVGGKSYVWKGRKVR